MLLLRYLSIFSKFIFVYLFDYLFVYICLFIYFKINEVIDGVVHGVWKMAIFITFKLEADKIKYG